MTTEAKVQLTSSELGTLYINGWKNLLKWKTEISLQNKKNKYADIG